MASLKAEFLRGEVVVNTISVKNEETVSHSLKMLQAEVNRYLTDSVTSEGNDLGQQDEDSDGSDGEPERAQTPNKRLKV